MEVTKLRLEENDQVRLRCAGCNAVREVFFPHLKNDEGDPITSPSCGVEHYVRDVVGVLGSLDAHLLPDEVAKAAPANIR
jgi:hypothetical protein